MESFSSTVVRMLQSLPPLMYVFYEMCQEVMNNSVYVC